MNVLSACPSATMRAASSAPEPTEATLVHTRILRTMLATDDCYAYWRHVDPGGPAADRTGRAFDERWFGTKSEARVRTLMTDMVERFDAYPEALSLLHSLGRIPAPLRPFLCHLHVQLADPIYRAFAGDFLPEKREEGRTTVDRPGVARWIDSLEPGRWGTATCTKFASNLLAVALAVGLVRRRRDPRQLPHVEAPEVIVGYALYLLRTVRIAGSLTDNPYLRSLGVTSHALRALAPGIPGIEIAQLGDVTDVTFAERSLTDWGLLHLGEAS